MESPWPVGISRSISRSSPKSLLACVAGDMPRSQSRTSLWLGPKPALHAMRAGHPATCSGSPSRSLPPFRPLPAHAALTLALLMSYRRSFPGNVSQPRNGFLAAHHFLFIPCIASFVHMHRSFFHIFFSVVFLGNCHKQTLDAKFAFWQPHNWLLLLSTRLPSSIILPTVMHRRDEKEELKDYSQRKKWEEEAIV